MIRGGRDRIFEDANGDIGDHLQNHIHSSNFIHFENHMERHSGCSPMLADRIPTRDPIGLQRVWRLRESSASPDSWHSHSLFDLLPTRGGGDPMMREGRRSVDIEWLRDVRRLSTCSPTFASLPTPNVVPGKLHADDGVKGAIRDCRSKSRVCNGRRIRRMRPSNKSNRHVVPEDSCEPRNGSYRGGFQQNSESEGYKTYEKEKHMHEILPKSLLEELNEFPKEIDAVASSSVIWNGQVSDASIRGHKTEVRTKKECKSRGPRTKAMISSDVEGQKEIFMEASKLLHSRSMYQMEGEEQDARKNVARAPKNGCGILSNWSRIHNRGKSFLDMAGRSLYCGLSDTRLKRGAPAPTYIDGYNIPVSSEQSSLLAGCDAEELPLLIEASESQGSAENVEWIHNYSGEVGILADHLLKLETDSDLVSEATSGMKYEANSYPHDRHQHLSQKYMPTTFADLVGQKLVAQALTNAVMKRKVGLLYSFYGPPGTGKTSCAHIFARALNCESMEHPKPCGFCDPCIAYDMGKSRNIVEIGHVSNIDFECIMDLLDDKVVPQLPSKYRVLIFEDCDALSPDCWSAITNAVDRVPKRVVFVLVCSGLNVMPHIIISRCQKFFFPKLKDVDIIYRLEHIADKENLSIDKDALRLIASKSDGSLRDAEMTLEQLSLLGQKISVPLVQEMVGIISDEKLVDLLDSALSSDTVNTVKSLRGIIESGVEPFALMSQLAMLITDIVAGCYDFTKDKSKRSFFQQLPLTPEDMENLRQALKKLSDAEKHLRVSKDKVTWLTAALLQLAPDHHHILPSISPDTSTYHRPLFPNHAQAHGEQPDNVRGPSTNVTATERQRHTAARKTPQENFEASPDMVMIFSGQATGTSSEQIEEIWFEVLERIQNKTVKELLSQEGKLVSVSFGAAPTVHLMFNSNPTKSAAERFRGHILEAFESVIGSPITIAITSDPNVVIQAPVISSTNNGSFNMVADLACPVDNTNQPVIRGSNEIIELDASPEIPNDWEHDGNWSKRNSGSAWSGNIEASCKNLDTASIPGSIKLSDQSQSLSLVRHKVCLGNVIQKTGSIQRSGWSKDKAISVADLEQDNMKQVPRSRSFLCWKASTATCRKFLFLRISNRRPQSLLKLVSCGKCLSAKSER